MPVTFKVADHLADPIQERGGRFVSKKSEFLQSLGRSRPRTGPVNEIPDNDILQSSIENADLGSVSPSTRGFVAIAYEAYNNHHHLEIRPDDVWMTILSQFGYYVNAHAEELRSSFVVHEGKKELLITTVGNRFTVDFGAMATIMTQLIDGNLVDKTLKDWLLPNFSTTTYDDTINYSIQLMSTLREYFKYRIRTLCGLPSVTLLGDKSDWEDLLARIPKFKEFGEEPSLWADRLTPVLKHFVNSFDEPDVEFWSKIAHRDRFGSGSYHISGWISVFSFWTPKGTLHDHVKAGRKNVYELGQPESPESNNRLFTLVIDDQEYPAMEGIISESGCEVPVELDDNGQTFQTKMVADQVARYFSSSQSEVNDSVRIRPVWFIHIVGEGEESA